MPSLGHTAGNAVREDEMAPGCLEDGSYYETVYCSTCGDVMDRWRVTVPATGHTFGAWSTAQDTVCGGAAVKTRSCEI